MRPTSVAGRNCKQTRILDWSIADANRFVVGFAIRALDIGARLAMVPLLGMRNKKPRRAGGLTGRRQ